MNTETFQLNFQSVAVIAIVLSVISLIFVGVVLIGPFEGQSEKLKQKRLNTKGAFLVVVTLLVLVTIAVIAFYVGTGITYEQKDTTWNVIDSIVSLISAVGTVGAIFAAIQVANRQNKISLFEKRYELYIIVTNFDVFARLLESGIAKAGTDVQIAFFIAFGIKEKSNDAVYIGSQCSAIIDKVRQLQFLFKDTNFEYVSNLMSCWKETINESLDKKQGKMSSSTIDKFVRKTKNKDFQIVLDDMRKELYLK